MTATDALVEAARRDPDLAALRLLAADEPIAIALVQALERHLASRPLERLERVWDLSASQAARLFGVSRQAYAKWHTNGVPADRRPEVSALDNATALLLDHVRVEQIPAVVRRPADVLNGQTLLEVARADPHEAEAAVRVMFDLRRVQP